MNKATEIAQRILDERGHLVTARVPGPQPVPKIGDKLIGPLAAGGLGCVPGPFFIVDTASSDDYINQAMHYGGEAKDAATRTASQALAFFKVVAE